MLDTGRAPRKPILEQIAEDEGFEAFIMGAQAEDNPFLGARLDDQACAWLHGWRMAARYHGR